MVDRRNEILSGNLSFPQQILKIVNPNDGEADAINAFWDNLWINYLREKPCDTITWHECVGSKIFNKVLFHLSKAGWITSSIDMNYASISLNDSKLEKWVSKEEIQNVKYHHKWEHYRMRRTKSILNDTVQVNGKHIATGLQRPGFMKAGNNKFSYDTKYIQKYLPQIAESLKKGLSGSTKDITYQEIIDNLTDWYSVDNEEYTLGNCILDSRGRAIFQCSKKIFNPVSSKEARAVLVTKAYPLDDYESVYQAIAELFGYRGKNADDKTEYGYAKYKNNELPPIENLHERIWVERIYDNLTHPQEWTVPIELDALASQIQILGCLLNNHVFMDETNLIHPEIFKDIWTVDYCPRNHIKKALTPVLYGSSKKPKELWDKHKFEYTQIMLNKISADIAIGKYADASRFKDFVINNVQPRVKMEVKIFNEEFFIECNRFKWEETKKVDYFIYHTKQSKIKKVSRQVHMVPETNQFKRYFQTLLIHNLDSQIANHVCTRMDWVIPNHDAFTVHPNDAWLVRKAYLEKLTEIYHNRREILRNYFDSIGIAKDYPEKNQEVIQEFSGYCLK